MEATGQTYSYYFTREFLPPLILFVLYTALSLLLIPVQLMLNGCPRLKRYFKTQFLIKRVFNTLLNKSTDKNGKTIYIIMKYRVPARHKVMMLAMALSMLRGRGVTLIFIYPFLIISEHIVFCHTNSLQALTHQHEHQVIKLP